MVTSPQSEINFLGADVESLATNKNIGDLSYNALYLATSRGHTECAKILITRGKASVHGSIDTGRPILAAISNNLTDIIKLLLTKGAEIPTEIRNYVKNLK